MNLECPETISVEADRREMTPSPAIWTGIQVVTAIGFLVIGLLGRPVQAPATARVPPQTFWVAQDGRPENDGSRESPLDLATALSAEGPARPGATSWLRGGTYRGSFASDLSGTAEAPIIVRQVPGERATIDSAGSGKDALAVGGRDTWFWGFEITSSDADASVQ